MATQDKVILMNRVEETLKPRMFANLLEEAVTEIQGHLEEFDVQRIVQSGDCNDDALESFIKAKRIEGRSEGTITRYMYTIGRFMAYAKVKTKDVNTYHIRAYFAEEQERGVSDSTIEGLRQVLSSYFGWLEDEHIIYANPMHNIGVIKCQKKVREAFSDSDIEKLKRNCTNKRDMAVVNFLLSTGCRISEAVSLNRNDINFETGECLVLGKGNKERTVYLNEVAILSMKEYLASRSDDQEALFIGRWNERILPGGIRTMLKRLEKVSGVENVHPHRFRRTLFTNLLNRGMPIQEVQVIAGHDKTDTTIRYYSANKSKIKNSYQRYAY